MLSLAGDWLEDGYGVQSTCPFQQKRHHNGMSLQGSCTAAADMYALGVLLALLALGHLPFPGDPHLLQDARTLQDPELIDELSWSVICQVVDPVWVSHN